MRCILTFVEDRRARRTLQVGSLALLLAAGLGPSTRGASKPRGQVEERRLEAIDIPADRVKNLTFKGWVDFPESQGHVAIIVMTRGDGDASDPFLFTEFAKVFPLRTPTIVRGENRYK
jgi:hypothetical protein